METALCDSDRICIVNEERQEVFLIALVDLNEFPLIFQKVQHSHFRQKKQKTKKPSNFFENQFKRQINVLKQNVTSRVSYVHNSMVQFWGASENVKFYAIF